MEIYVGNIPPTIKSKELSFLYQSFGTIVFIDIKNRCQPPFAFILFDNTGSAYNAVASTNGCLYKGYQFQVKLLTPDDSSLDISLRDKSMEEKRKLAKKRKKVPPTPENGKPGALDDPLRKGLSGAGAKWYLRYLESGIEPKKARIKAEEHKFIALGDEIEIARKKAEERLFGMQF